jgi:bifunctional N-acetylglucosamine-1-phosphate-uridyltransferase/glucosamine-1-phosphate-acetyltransferase GlmU-like protein
MNKNNFIVTVLAGGRGSRMQSDLPKVLHLVDGVPMIVKILKELINMELQVDKFIIVVGQFKDLIYDEIVKYINIQNVNIEFALQDVPQGTGHAVLCTLDLLDEESINLIVNGDNPMLSSQTIILAYNNFILNKTHMQILAISASDPTGCGRIIVHDDVFERIVEEKDCSIEQKNIKLINCGIYLFSTFILKKYIPRIKNNNSQKEYYLTDIVEIYKSDVDNKIGLYVIDEDKELEVININTKEQLDNLNDILTLKK